MIAVTEAVLSDYMGRDWVSSNVRENRQPFLRVKGDEPLDSYRHHDRVLSLAEALFNLQATPGIDDKVTEIRSGDVESGLAELDAALFLSLCRLRFSFRTRSGIKGEDYDIEVELRRGAKAAVESKCKVEGTEASFNTIRNVLQRARRQLPPDRPGLVFIKLPETWHTVEGLAGLIRKGLAEGWRGSGRIHAAVVHWERWEARGPLGARRHVSWNLEVNQGARNPVERLDTLLEPLSNPPWFSFLNYLGVGHRRTPRLVQLPGWKLR